VTGGRASPRPVQVAAVLLDLLFLLAGAGLVFVLLGGRVLSNTGLFQLKLTRVDLPVNTAITVLVVKAVTGWDRGVFAWLAARRAPVVSGVASALHAFDRMLHAWLTARWRELALCVTAVVLTLGVLEGYMRWFPETLPAALGNHVTSAYHTGPSGIYRYVPKLGLTLMRPNQDRLMYFNGYWWRHRTDSSGFRNPADRSAATVVLLGDSMIYGHGVDEPSTVRHHLEALLGEPVVNLGMQGSSIYQEYEILKAIGLGLHPRYAFAFFLGNDIDDLGLLSVDEIEAFLRTPVHDHTTRYVKSPPAPPPEPSPGARLRELYVYRAFDFLRHHLEGLVPWPRAASAQAYAAGSRGGLQLRFHLHALGKMQDLATRHGIAFVYVFIYTGVLADEPALEQVLSDYCAANGIAFLTLRPAIERAVRNGEGVFLPGDGHFADAGARLVARVLAEYIGRPR
jgi:hypothetical protein